MMKQEISLGSGKMSKPLEPAVACVSESAGLEQGPKGSLELGDEALLKFPR